MHFDPAQGPAGILDQGQPSSRPFDPLATGVVPPNAFSPAEMSSGGTIQLSIDNKDFTFSPGTTVTVGRDPGCLVTLEERHSLVSRQHLRIIHSEGQWWIKDGSSKGTFIDGRRITTPYKAEGAFMVQLGDAGAGTSMRVITAGDHSSGEDSPILLIAAIAILILLGIVAIFFALRASDANAQGAPDLADAPSSNSAIVPASSSTDLAGAKQSTVMLLSDDGGLGSGFFVSDDLIVTNQHVAALAPTLFVAVSREVDEPAVVEFTAATLALHPFLDVAVLRLAEDLDGNAVDDAGLPPVVLGDSSNLTLGDPVVNTGFPANLSLISHDDMGELQLPPVSTTSGEAASFSIWPGCSNPDQAEFIPIGSPPGVTCAPDGDVDRGIVITTFSSGQGASGSPVFRGSEVVAVVFAGPEDEANAGRNITTASFNDWVNGVIANNI